jgi:O-methyltransferase involved in polyketide biosynthesis
MAEKTKITFTHEQETLLIVLYSKAHPVNAAYQPDPYAQEILAGADYDFARLKTPIKSILLVGLRAKKLDQVTADFLAEHPNGVVLHLGCGLDSRCRRLSHPQAAWYDLDFPEVIAVRRQFYSEAPGYHMLASSVTDLTWLDQAIERDRPALVIAEGLLMYLEEMDIRRLFLALKARFPSVRLAADIFSALTARSAASHPSLHKTGATIRWGIDDARSLEAWAPGIRLEEEWFFSQSPDIAFFPPVYRLGYLLAKYFRAANLAHRIVVYKL